MYKFSDKKNREDVIAFRWPKACMSCGNDILPPAESQHAIIGKFYIDKKTTRHDKRHTQVLVKLPGFFYMCKDCVKVIDSAAANPPNNYEKTVKTLQESPWMEFIEVETTGHVKLPNGQFKEKLHEANPDALFKSKPSPLTELRRRMGV